MLSLLIATENTHHFEILAANKKIMLLEFCEDQIDRIILLSPSFSKMQPF